MTTDPDKADSCDPPPTAGDSGGSVCRHSLWGVVLAIPLYVYGAVPLLYGMFGLLFVPGILSGRVVIGRHTTPVDFVGFIAFHLSIAAHGGAVFFAAMCFRRTRWRRGLNAIELGTLVPVILIAALYIAFIAFEPAGGG